MLSLLTGSAGGVTSGVGDVARPSGISPSHPGWSSSFEGDMEMEALDQFSDAEVGVEEHDISLGGDFSPGDTSVD